MSFARSGNDAFQHDRTVEELCAVVFVGFLFEFVFSQDAVFLRPFKEFALEVHFLVGHAVDVEQAANDAFLDKPLAVVVATVEVNSAHKRFKGVSADVVAARSRLSRRLDEAVEAEVGREFVERRALHDFAARAGEEALTFARVAVVDDVAHNGFEDGIAKIFQTLVVDRFTSAVAVALRFVGQRGAVKFKIVWIKSEYSV